MNNIFSVKRFALLLKRQWLEFGKIYLISLGVLAGIIVIFYALNLSENILAPISQSTLRFRDVLFVITGFLFVTIISSTYFAHLGQKSKATMDLMIPASIFEKFLAGLFYTLFASIASYLLVFGIIDFAILFKIRQSHNATTTVTNYLGKTEVTDNLAYFFTVKREPILQFFYFLPFFFSSLFLLGSVYFNRFHYIKTAITIMIFGIAWVSSVVYIMNRITRNTVWVGGPYWQNERNGTMMLLIVGTTLTLIFWAIGYLRLKEKEV